MEMTVRSRTEMVPKGAHKVIAAPILHSNNSELPTSFAMMLAWSTEFAERLTNRLWNTRLEQTRLLLALDPGQGPRTRVQNKLVGSRPRSKSERTSLRLACLLMRLLYPWYQQGWKEAVVIAASV